ncbi:MAG TPA: ribonuclease HII [Kiritimatiellia bacterium]|nr:ribonuclease HII [Kiritimatiellia bacterium]HMO98716.1 ribonuclease HII [Kiritimatiellia bacterium]HMP97931.1 ribonuclease HII [Kiritimatiellia bacterium]
MLDYERRGWASGYVRVAGVDEAGRGPLAGPVVAAAVIAPREQCEALWSGPWKRLTDSKRLTDKIRRAFFVSIQSEPGVEVGVGRCEAEEIDAVNILQATYRAMARAVEALPAPPDFVLVDGLPVKGLPAPHNAIVGGDGKSLLIAAASIIAKVTRDDRMLELDRRYPEYGFSRHKGYGTREHLEGLRRLGPCPAHRRSFAPVRQLGLTFQDT